MIDSAFAAHYLDAIGSRSSGVKALLEQARASGPTLAPFVEAMTFAPGERLIQQGSRPGALFLIVAGNAEAVDPSHEITGSRLSAPDVVGEVSLVTKLPAIADVVAVSQVQALPLSYSALAGLLASSPLTALALVRWFAEDVVDKILRTDGSNGPPLGKAHTMAPDCPVIPSVGPSSVVERLAEMQAFQWTHEEVQSGVSTLFCTRMLAPGERLAAGEESDSLYLLVAGTALVDGPDGPISAFVGGHPQCEHVLIGELSFLTNRPRAASITALTECELLELSSTRLVDMAKISPAFTWRLLLGVLRAECRDLVDNATLRARSESVIDGNWKRWFVDDADYASRFGA